MSVFFITDVHKGCGREAVLETAERLRKYSDVWRRESSGIRTIYTNAAQGFTTCPSSAW